MTSPACQTFCPPDIMAPSLPELAPARLSTSPAAGRWVSPAQRPAHLLGAACVIVGDLIPERLAQAKSFGCEVVDVSKSATVRGTDQADRWSA